MTRIGAPATSAVRPTSITSDKALIAKLKSSYEHSVKKNSDTIFKGEKKATPKDLKGAALQDYKEYARTTKDGMINSGPPVIKTAMVDGQKVFFVSGDVSDTGTQYGFYNAQGKLLAMAYSGQGEHPNAAGVDWMS